MQVVLDTNAFHSDLRMKAALRVLLSQARVGELLLVVPEVVIQEVLKRYRVRFEETARELGAAARELRSLGADVPLLNLESPIEATVRYEAERRDRLHQTGVLIALFPSADHEEVLDRAVERRKPFKDGGAGYQDTLIWLTILEQVELGPVAFVSRNTNDFGKRTDDGWELATELQEDLSARGFDRERVKLYPTIQDFLGEGVQPEEEVRDLRDRLAADDDLVATLEAEMQVLVEHWASPASDLTLLSQEVESAEWSNVRVYDLRVTDEHSLDHDDELFAYLTARVSGTVDFVLDRRAADRLSTREKRFISESIGEAAMGSKEVDGQVDAELIWNRDGSVVEFDVFDVRESEASEEGNEGKLDA